MVIRAGDVHAQLGLTNAVPAVCSAIEARAFSEAANVRLLGRSGPRQGPNTIFKFEIVDQALTYEAARSVLENRYGAAIPARGNYVTAFRLPDSREIALQNGGRSIALWVEDPGTTPPVTGSKTYLAAQGRNSNLPQRLTHDPRAEFKAQGFPRPVLQLQLGTLNELRSALNWYETAAAIDRKALDALKARFLKHFPDFEDRTFSASDGQYWIEERKYKQELIDRAQEAMGADPALSSVALGEHLLAVAVTPPSNLLDWRTTERLKEIRSAHPGLLEERCANLVRVGDQRHAVFGEGASEEIVLPRLAEALGVPMDRSFVAIVPIGGRYIEHFWRLVSQLGIPHTTLLDFDLGRSSGDTSQIKAIAAAVESHVTDKSQTDKTNITAAGKFTRETDWSNAGWKQETLESWATCFEHHGVFFSMPLDLDMAMLETFPDAYKKLPKGAKGPQKADDADRQKEAGTRVLGTGGFGVDPYAGGPYMPLFPWYAYLFLGTRGKPAVHLQALAQLDDAALKKSCPPVLKRLIDRVASALVGPLQ